MRQRVYSAHRYCALQHADEITPRVVAHLRQCSVTLVTLLQAMPGVEVVSARGGMYAFFACRGMAIRWPTPSAW